MPPKLATIDTVGRNWVVLIYGYMGSGKTHLAATAQDNKAFKNVLFCNCEGGLKTVMKRGDILYEDTRSIDKLEQVFYRVKGQKAGYEGINTIVIDSVSEFQSVYLEELAKTNNSKDGQNTLRDYMKSTNKLRKLFREMRDSGLNIIWIAHPSEVFEKGAEEGDPPECIQPQLTNKLSKSLMGFVDYCWFLESVERKIKSKKTGKTIKKTERILHTEDFLAHNGVTKIRAKTRGADFLTAIGKEVANPNLSELYKIYLESMKGK